MKVIINKEQSEETLQEFFKSFGIVGNSIDDACGFKADENKYEAVKTASNIVLQGIMIGLIEIKESNGVKFLKQSLFAPINEGELNISNLEYKNSMKTAQLRVLAQQGANKGVEEYVEALTGIAKKLVLKLNNYDMQLAGAITTLFLA